MIDSNGKRVSKSEMTADVLLLLMHINPICCEDGWCYFELKAFESDVGEGRTFLLLYVHDDTNEECARVLAVDLNVLHQARAPRR